jgi:hypothetical protein
MARPLPEDAACAFKYETLLRQQFLCPVEALEVEDLGARNISIAPFPGNSTSLL